MPSYLRYADLETPPSLADLGFLARQFRNTTGKPLDHQVELHPAYDYKTYQWPEVDPANPYAAIPAMAQGPQLTTRRVEGIGFPITHLEDWLSDQGYFDQGRSAQELMQTPEGLQMLRTLRGDGTPHADPDMLRFMDAFRPPKDWWSRPRKPPEPLR